MKTYRICRNDLVETEKFGPRLVIEYHETDAKGTAIGDVLQHWSPATNDEGKPSAWRMLGRGSTFQAELVMDEREPVPAPLSDEDRRSILAEIAEESPDLSLRELNAAVRQRTPQATAQDGTPLFRRTVRGGWETMRIMVLRKPSENYVKAAIAAFEAAAA